MFEDKDKVVFGILKNVKIKSLQLKFILGQSQLKMNKFKLIELRKKELLIHFLNVDQNPSAHRRWTNMPKTFILII